MPTATKFESEGVGNGFPYCLEMVDVDDLDYWTTLSGHNKDSVGAPTEASIRLSFVNASKLCWSLYKLNFYLLYQDSGSMTNLVFDVGEPRERVCQTYSGYWHRDSTGGTGLINLYAIINIRIVKMYNNGVYVGMGLGNIGNTVPAIEIVARAGFCSCGLASMMDDSEAASKNQDFAYIEMDGLHFVGHAMARNFYTTIATASIPYAEYSNADDPAFKLTAEIFSLEFYGSA